MGGADMARPCRCDVSSRWRRRRQRRRTNRTSHRCIVLSSVKASHTVAVPKCTVYYCGAK